MQEEDDTSRPGSGEASNGSNNTVTIAPVSVGGGAPIRMSIALGGGRRHHPSSRIGGAPLAQKKTKRKKRVAGSGHGSDGAGAMHHTNKRQRQVPRSTAAGPDTELAVRLGFEDGTGFEFGDAQPEGHLATRLSAPGATTLALEDTHAKVLRLRAAGVALAEAGRFRAAIAQWDEAIGLMVEHTHVGALLRQRCDRHRHSPSVKDTRSDGASDDAGAGESTGAGAGDDGESTGAGAGAETAAAGLNPERDNVARGDGGGGVGSEGGVGGAPGGVAEADAISAAALFEMKAQALMEVEEYFAAIECAEGATRLAPQWCPGWETLGRARLNFGELDLCVEALEKVRVRGGGLCACLLVCLFACLLVCLFACLLVYYLLFCLCVVLLSIAVTLSCRLLLCADRLHAFRAMCCMFHHCIGHGGMTDVAVVTPSSCS